MKSTRFADTPAHPARARSLACRYGTTVLRQRSSLSSIAAVLLLSQLARGQQFIVAIRYQAPAECPTETWFFQQVLRRARHARLARSDESSREFRVVITESANKSRGRLEFTDVDSKVVQRELEANNCVEVVSGLVLITALAIDPLLANPTQVSSTGEASQREPSLAPADANRHPTIPPRAIAEIALPNQAIGQGSGQRHWSAMLGLSVGAMSGTAPVWAPGAALYSEFASPNRSVTLRLRFSYSESGEIARDAANTRFWLEAGSAEGCAWAAQLTNGLRIWPCAAIQAGVLHAEGRQSPRLPFPNSTNSLWLAGDVALRAQIDLSRTFVFEIEGQGLAPVVRHSYVYERPFTLEYRTPALGAAGYAGIGVRLGR